MGKGYGITNPISVNHQARTQINREKCPASIFSAVLLREMAISQKYQYKCQQRAAWDITASLVTPVLWERDAHGPSKVWEQSCVLSKELSRGWTGGAAPSSSGGLGGFSICLTCAAAESC